MFLWSCPCFEQGSGAVMVFLSPHWLKTKLDTVPVQKKSLHTLEWKWELHGAQELTNKAVLTQKDYEKSSKSTVYIPIRRVTFSTFRFCYEDLTQKKTKKILYILFSCILLDSCMESMTHITYFCQQMACGVWWEWLTGKPQCKQHTAYFNTHSGCPPSGQMWWPWVWAVTAREGQRRTHSSGYCGRPACAPGGSEETHEFCK